MQGKDPFLALLGVFILSMTLVFCGKGSVASPPPAALGQPSEIPQPASNGVAPPSLPPSPPVSTLKRPAMMSGDWTCWLWTMVGAGFLGWGIKGLVLGPAMNEKRREVERLKSKVIMLTNQPPEVRTVEKRVEVPVERVVLKRVEVPVEKVVDRPVDSPEHLARIKALEGEVAVIARLLPQIAQLQTIFSQVGGRSGEGRVLVPVDNPEQLARIKAIEDEMAVITELRTQMAELRALLLEVSERVAEKPTETPTEQLVVEKREAPIDNPEQLTRIQAIESELAVIAELREQMAELRALSLQAGEKVVEKQLETPTEQHGAVPVDNPEQLARIKALEREVAEVAELRAQLAQLAHLAQLQAASLRVGEMSIEKQIEPPVKQVVVQNGSVSIDPIRESAEVAPAGAVELSDEEQMPDQSPDDLKHIRGVGPALEQFLHKRGVFWFRQMATWSQKDIDKFEFLLPNFSGRIQRENWVRSAQVEYYKKYKQWLGDGEPPSESPNLHAQMAELHAAALQDGEKAVEERIETPTEANGEVPIEQMRDQSDEGQGVGELPDDLKQIRGIGPALERFLHKRGVFWFRQVATWRQADIDKFEFLLPNFGGRIQRENWVHSAKAEHYKKYKQWLGDGEPPSITPEAH